MSRSMEKVIPVRIASEKKSCYAQIMRSSLSSTVALRRLLTSKDLTIKERSEFEKMLSDMTKIKNRANNLFDMQ